MTGTESTRSIVGAKVEYPFIPNTGIPLISALAAFWSTSTLVLSVGGKFVHHSDGDLDVNMLDTHMPH